MSGDKNENSKKRKNDKRSYFCVRRGSTISEEEFRLRTSAYSDISTVRNKSERSEIGWDDIQPGGEAESGNYGDAGASTDTDDVGRQEGLSVSTEIGGESLQSGGTSEAWRTQIADSYYNGFWPTFTSEEEKRQWWAKATLKFCDWRETQSAVCGVYDGPTKGLHEKFRRARIKQLGNGIVRSIAELHAERIAHHELNAESYL